MRALVLAALLLAAASREAAAKFRDKDIASSSGQFLKLGADARAQGMGEAVRSVAEDASSAYWNPAGLAGLRARHASITHGAYYQDVFYDFVAYAHPIRSPLAGRRERELRSNQLGAIAVGLFYLNAGEIKALDNTGAETGERFTPQDVAVMAAWGLALTRVLDFGIGGKYVSSRIQRSAATGSFDLGARLRLRPFEIPYTVSLGVHNLGGKLRFIEREDPLPLMLTVGQSVRPFKDLTLAWDMVAPRDNDPYPALGAEYRFSLYPELVPALRIGYQNRPSGGDLEGLAGMSVGGGLTVNRFTVDYSWVPFGSLGDTHRFTLNYRF